MRKPINGLLLPTILTERELKSFFLQFLLQTYFQFRKASFVYRAQVVTVDDSYYFFGGYTSNASSDNKIARFDITTKSWSKVGEMVIGRHAHSVIYLQSSFLVVGGQGLNDKSEKCTLSNGQMSCSVQNPQLNNYDYSELFLVSPDYCH